MVFAFFSKSKKSCNFVLVVFFWHKLYHNVGDFLVYNLARPDLGFKMVVSLVLELEQFVEPALLLLILINPAVPAKIE